MLILFVINLLIFGNLCKHLAAHKGYDGYFWTDAFLGIAGLIYVVGLPDRTLGDALEKALCSVKRDG